MTTKQILVGCRLPNGIIIEHGDKKVTLNGLNRAVIIGAGYATTEVDADFWAAWLKVNKEFTPVKNGAIFAAPDAASVADMAKDLAAVKTGLEQIDPNAKHEGGVKTVTTE